MGNVVTADVKASNGVIHVIDNVILGAPEPASEPAVGDVVDVAVGAGAFTILAPSDDAFAKLPAGTLESLTTEQAKAIVSRHVVAGATVLAADVATGPVGTFGGETIDLIKTEQGGVQVSYNGNAVNVVTADVKA